MVVVTKKASASKSQDSLENYSKLNRYALMGSINAQKRAQANGIAFTIIKNGEIYKVYPNGEEEVIGLVEQQDNVFQPISIAG